MSAGDDVRACLAVSAEAGHVPALRGALMKVAERLDRADEDDESARDAVAKVTDLLDMLDARLEAVEERLGMYVQRR